MNALRRLPHSGNVERGTWNVKPAGRRPASSLIPFSAPEVIALSASAALREESLFECTDLAEYLPSQPILDDLEFFSGAGQFFREPVPVQA